MYVKSVIIPMNLLLSIRQCFQQAPPSPHIRPIRKIYNIFQKTARRESVLASTYTSGLNCDVSATPSSNRRSQRQRWKNGPTSRSIKIEGEKGVKEEGMVPASHNKAPARSACPAVDTCCECGPTSTCKIARCECPKAAHVCDSCHCLEWCVHNTPQT